VAGSRNTVASGLCKLSIPFFAHLELQAEVRPRSGIFRRPFDIGLRSR
jgi:hypothetical protein